MNKYAIAKVLTYIKTKQSDVRANIFPIKKISMQIIIAWRFL